MFLQELKLQNIRSYSDETISFPEGSTMLSGDIGSGKSSILLAIEFALFGTSRPDLPAELLLRKGTTTGSVELSFQINQQQVSIKRSLKKQNDSIKQLPGHLIINNLKKELMPIELKSEIISLLGYPEDLVSKNKNQLLRYTIYTPQEEMKKILQEDAETRLDVLRKIFNIDKYKIIRDNLQIYLKSLRTSIAVSNTRLEPLPDKEQEFSALEKQETELDRSLLELKPKLKESTERLQLSQKAINSLEEQQNIYLQLKRQEELLQNSLEEKKFNVSQLQEKNLLLQQKIEELSLPEISPELLKQEIAGIELQKNDNLQKKVYLNENISHLQKTIQDTNYDNQQITLQLSSLAEKESSLNQLKQELSLKPALSEKNKLLEIELEKINAEISKNEALSNQSKLLQEKISQLDNCPLCLQEVSHLHKNKITQREAEKISKSETYLTSARNNKQLLWQEKETLSKKLEVLQLQEHNFTKLNMEIQRLKEKALELEKNKEKIKLAIQRNNQLMQELTNLADLAEIIKALTEKQKLLEQFQWQEHLTQQLKEYSEQLLISKNKIDDLNKQLAETASNLKEKNDLSEQIKNHREAHSSILNQEKELAVEKAQLQANLENTLKQKNKLKEELNRMTEEKNKLIHNKEIYHWLEGHFLKLTYTIEKHIMLNIHRLFNQLFQEWFSTLIDDEQVTARIDDSFSPIIEQNGYEIFFDNLSGGEKTSASLAYRLALNKVINSIIHEIKTNDLLILDEPTDGFSTEQLDKVRDVLERLDLQQIIIVSHEAKIESFVDNVIRISKENHVSSVM